MKCNFEIATGASFPKSLKSPSENGLLEILKDFGIKDVCSIKLIDSTHDDLDVRLNYIVDKKYVLRFCNAPDMTEARLQGLNRLIARYWALKIQCPRFILHPDGKYLHSWNELQYYVSEYIDMPIAGDTDIRDEDRLTREVSESVARFAEAYKNIDLIDTMGMYSLFDLSPFDKECGIDEKEQNFNGLIESLSGIQAFDLAEKLTCRHRSVREKLKSIYKSLPRCVFQGDENYSNILIDSNEHFRGFIDFNLSGTEVVINQLTNLTGFDYNETNLQPMGAMQRLEYALNYHKSHLEPLKSIYHMNSLEQSALCLYEWIVMTAQWPTVCFFKKELDNPELSGEIIELLHLIADLPEKAFE